LIANCVVINVDALRQHLVRLLAIETM